MVQIDRLIIYSAYWRTDRSFLFLSEPYLSVDVDDLVKASDAACIINAYIAQTGSTYGRYQLSRFEELRPILSGLLPFQGYVLCLNEAMAPTSDEIKAHLGFRAANIEENVQKLIGRPRKVDAAMGAYSRHFPNGHGGYTLKVVQSILLEEEGMSVSIDTIKRAIEALKNDA